MSFLNLRIYHTFATHSYYQKKKENTLDNKAFITVNKRTRVSEWELTSQKEPAEYQGNPHIFGNSKLFNSYFLSFLGVLLCPLSLLSSSSPLSFQVLKLLENRSSKRTERRSFSAQGVITFWPTSWLRLSLISDGLDFPLPELPRRDLSAAIQVGTRGLQVSPFILFIFSLSYYLPVSLSILSMRIE